jgi:RNA-dependent RNA polymerase
MIKFVGNAEHSSLEVLSVSKPIKTYLNRQIITLLSSLGTPDTAFIYLLDSMIRRLERALHSDHDAKSLLLDNGGGTIAFQMLQAGFHVEKEPHLQGIVRALRNQLLLDLELKARILIPNAVTLIGIMDETHTMPEGTVFFQYTDAEDKTVRLPNGTTVAVYRSPSLHPGTSFLNTGDVRLLKTVDVPSLRHLVNVVVYPAVGNRPHPNEMSGGDLDGDIYSIIFEETLLPNDSHTPMQYDAPRPPITTSNEITESALANFYVDYMKNDNLGRIANTHVVYADLYGAMDPRCLKLAELHSTAVDFCKTGVPAVMGRDFPIDKYPDFMAKDSKPCYKSKKVLGEIYSRVRRVEFEHASDYRLYRNSLDTDVIIPGYEAYCEEAHNLLFDYNTDLWAIMEAYGVILV